MREVVEIMGEIGVQPYGNWEKGVASPCEIWDYVCGVIHIGSPLTEEDKNDGHNCNGPSHPSPLEYHRND